MPEVGITNRLAALKFPNAASLHQEDETTYLLVADNQKKYKVIKLEGGKLSVTRDYTPREKSFLYAIAKAIKHLLGKTSCQQIEKAFTHEPSLFELAKVKNEPSSSSSSKVSFSNNDYSDDKYSKASLKIQSVVRGFIARKKVAQIKQPNSAFYTMKHPSLKSYDDKPLTYYFDRKGKLPTSRPPIKQTETKPSKNSGAASTVNQSSHLPPAAKPKDDGVLEGATKVLKGRDDTKVALETKLPMTRGSANRINRIALALKDYKSCLTGVAVNSKLILAKNGGQDLLEYCKTRRLKIKSFRAPCSDLKRLHQNKMAIRDIKPANMTIDDQGNIKFIDLDSMYVPDVTPRECSAPKDSQGRLWVLGTAGYVTKELVESRDTLDIDLYNTDNYAMLLSMLETTTDHYHDLTRVNDIPEKSVLNQMNRNHFDQWVKLYIKPEYQDQVKHFMLNPANVTFEEPLYDIINWNAE